MTYLVPYQNNNAFIPQFADTNTKYRLGVFVDWLAENEQRWIEPDLRAFAYYLQNEYVTRSGTIMSPVSAKNLLATVRKRYREILRDPSFESALEILSYDACMEEGFEPNPANVQAGVVRILRRLEKAIDPINAKVSVKKIKDKTDSQGLRLTAEQAAALLQAPGRDSITGIRDTAIIALMLGTGIRVGELCDLQVPDLYETVDGEDVLLIRSGKGNAQRVVYYGGMIGCLDYVAEWLDEANIDNGYVFRSFDLNNGINDKLSTDGVFWLLKQYPAIINGREVQVRPHDLRRTYARLQYDAGLEVDMIRLNLGHNEVTTTWRYIGNINGAARRAVAVNIF